MKVPEITLEDWKDYARRHDMKSEVPDEEAFARALHNVYLREQQIEDQREQNRQKHTLSNSTGLKPSNKGELELSQVAHLSRESEEVATQGSSNLPLGDIKKESPE